MRATGFFDDEERDFDALALNEMVARKRAVGIRNASVRLSFSRVPWVTITLYASVPIEIVQKDTEARTASIVTKHNFQPQRTSLSERYMIRQRAVVIA